jgi:hypothetical protein
MPDDVGGEELILQGAQVAAAESRAGRSHQVLVRLGHRASFGHLAAPAGIVGQQAVKASGRVSGRWLTQPGTAADSPD